MLRKVIYKAKKIKEEFFVYQTFPELKKKQLIYEDKVHLEAAINWLCTAQKTSNCDGVLALYNLLKKKWGEPYRETTGYIIPTFINYSKITGNKEFERRALAMGEWLFKEQLSDGAYGEKTKNSSIRKKVFNTGQIMLGLCNLYDYTKEEKFLLTTIRSANWLISIQEKDGRWEKDTTKGAKTYHSRVAWPLLELYKRTGDIKFKVAAEKNLEWVLKQQNKNGWFENCSLSEPTKPWTHLIAYTIRGLIESSTLLQSEEIFEKGYEAASAMLSFYKKNKNNDFDFLPGTFDAYWNSTDNYSCLTGDAQIAIIWLKIWNITNEKRFKNGANHMINQIKETQIINSPHEEIVGGIAGSYPYHGEYARFSMLNWATKFFIDALILKTNKNIQLLS